MNTINQQIEKLRIAYMNAFEFEENDEKVEEIGKQLDVLIAKAKSLKTIRSIGAKLVNTRFSFIVSNLSSAVIQEFDIVGESITKMSYFSFIAIYYSKDSKEIKII